MELPSSDKLGNHDFEEVPPQTINENDHETTGSGTLVDSSLKNDSQSMGGQVKERSEISPGLSDFTELLKSIQDMVASNSQKIQDLKEEVSTQRSHSKDTSVMEEKLRDEEKKSEELLRKLEDTKSQLAKAKAENQSLTNTVKEQDILLDQRKTLGFTAKECESLLQYTAIIIFDTCSIMNYPNLLDGVQDGELVVVPKDVNNELEHHKVRRGYDERKIKAQRAITAIFNYKRQFPLIYSEAILDLVPEVYRANAGEKEQNDNKILAVAIRFKRFSNIPVIFITDDRSLSNKASGEDIEVWTAEDFLNPPQQAEEVIEEAAENNTSESVELEMDSIDEIQHMKAVEEFLGQKISTRNLHLESSQISVLQNNGIRTIEEFMAQTEASFSSMKVKKGMRFTALYLNEQASLRKKLENM